jgi:N-acetylglucosaminyl-diphospho-decaprenol L-rhamnosyltransferase
MIERSTQTESSATQHGSLPAVDPNRAADVTVVVVTYNSARHLEALGCALASSPLPPRRMLAVDNASTDDSVVRAGSAGFEVLETGSNDGFGAACNVGLRASSTEFVLFCNPDVRPSPDALGRLVAALIDNPTAAIAGVAFDEQYLARRFSRITGGIWIFLPTWLKDPLRRFGIEMPIDPTNEQVVVDYVVGAFMLCRVAALRLVDGFDERFFLYCEEEDLCRRLGEIGWQTLLVPTAGATHETSTSSEGTDGKAMAPFLLHSLYWYYRKYHTRTYAEFGRFVLSICVVIDKGFRAVTRNEQAYGPGTARAPFRGIHSLRDKNNRSCRAVRDITSR